MADLCNLRDLFCALGADNYGEAISVAMWCSGPFCAGFGYSFTEISADAIRSQQIDKVVFGAGDILVTEVVRYRRHRLQ